MKFCHCSGATAEMLTERSVAAEMLRGETQLPCAFMTLTESPGRSALKAVACWNLRHIAHTWMACGALEPRRRDASTCPFIVHRSVVSSLECEHQPPQLARYVSVRKPMSYDCDEQSAGGCRLTTESADTGSYKQTDCHTVSSSLCWLPI